MSTLISLGGFVGNAQNCHVVDVVVIETSCFHTVAQYIGVEIVDVSSLERFPIDLFLRRVLDGESCWIVETYFTCFAARETWSTG